MFTIFTPPRIGDGVLFSIDFCYVRRRRRWCFHFGLFVCLSVCLSVCPSDNWKSRERILTKFLEGYIYIGHGPGTKWLNFGYDPDHRPDPGVRTPKSGFSGLSKKYPVDSDQSCIANLHCKNHSAILLCWRSAEVSDLSGYFQFVTFFLCFFDSKITKKMAGPICMKLSGKVWDDLVTFWVNSEKPRDAAMLISLSALSTLPAIGSSSSPVLPSSDWECNEFLLHRKRGRGLFVFAPELV